MSFILHVSKFKKWRFHVGHLERKSISSYKFLSWLTRKLQNELITTTKTTKREKKKIQYNTTRKIYNLLQSLQGQTSFNLKRVAYLWS